MNLDSMVKSVSLLISLPFIGSVQPLSINESRLKRLPIACRLSLIHHFLAQALIIPQEMKGPIRLPRVTAAADATVIRIMVDRDPLDCRATWPESMPCR